MNRMRILAWLALAAGLAFNSQSVWAGGGGGGLCAGFAAGSELLMRDNCFNGVAHFAEAGGRLLVRNEGHLPHSLTAVDGSFDTGLLEAGQTATIQTAGPGIVRVYCTLHGTASGEGMAGVLVVGQPGPGALAAGPGAADLRAALGDQTETLRSEMAVQSQALADIRAEMAALGQTVERSASGSRPAAALGIAGMVLGGAALAVVFRRRTPGGPA